MPDPDRIDTVHNGQASMWRSTDGPLGGMPVLRRVLVCRDCGKLPPNGDMDNRMIPSGRTTDLVCGPCRRGEKLRSH